MFHSFLRTKHTLVTGLLEDDCVSIQVSLLMRELIQVCYLNVPFETNCLSEAKLMSKMAEEIPSLKSRAERLAKEAAQLAALEKTREKEAKKAAKGKKK
jgi:hypothetical protein